MNDYISIVLAYLLGAIPFGFLIPKLFGINDIRRHGSGNVGSTNAWRVAGPTAGILVMLFDIGKGMAAVFIPKLFSTGNINTELLALFCGLMAVLGHVFTVYLKFKGGKGVNTTLGVMLSLLPIQALAGLAVFIITAIITRYISLGSILAATAFNAAVIITYLAKWQIINLSYVPVALAVNILIVVAHRQNIRRLLHHQENKFSLGSKNKLSSNQAGENV